jgi:pimeloyl-ACP methyl ester carboxylesterase
MKHAIRSSQLLNLFAVLLLIGLQATANAQQSTQQEVRIKPLTKSEIRAIHQGLLTGQAPQMPDLTRDNGNGTDTQCQIPAFFGLNRQGYVTVPEDYENPTGRQIKVFYYGRVQAGKDPVVFFNGGPGSDSHSSSQIIENYYQQAPEIQQVSFIYIDQRGTGCSDAFPTDPTPETVERLTHYTSESFGAGSQWKVFGQSFGGLITHRYAMVAPQSMKAGFAHGFSLMKDQNEWLTLRIKSQKRVLEVYFQQFPGDRQRLENLRQLIAEDLCFKDGETEICGPKVLDALTVFLGFSTNWPYLDLTIKSLLKADGTLNSTALTDFVRNYVFGVYNDSGLAGSVISMVEISNGESDQDACKKVDAKIEAEGDHPNDWLLNECRLLAGMTNDKWTELLKGIHVQALMTPEMMKDSLKKNPKLPFFLYSGQKDVFVPVETFQEETSLLGNLITYRSYPDSGHEGFYTERQVWKDIVSVH